MARFQDIKSTQNISQISCIDFFAGIGAWELACELLNQQGGLKFNTQRFIEIDVNAQKSLQLNFPNIPIHSDIKTYQPTLFEADVYFVSFPCTGTSSAGKRTGLEHPESNLWYESLRCIIIGRPNFVLIEQPEGFIHRGLRAVLGGLRMAKYCWENPQIISAKELGAPHKRNRIFIIAHSDHLSLQQRQGWKCWSESIGADIETARQTFSYPQTQPGGVCLDDELPAWLVGIRADGWWAANSPPVNSGIEPRTAGRRECINLYGRSIVPLQAAIALMRLKYLVELLIN
ncbi:DNA cytosine methyltransferase [Kamptonema animale CS-326]|jgi:DNA (cytosine-5)-methyltransferase 1|uniref:DNA cytosine methyltransferase n=1 Tax=Kamptonema animale TaxID=92934 RepID=UPI00232AC6F0|nr:DNA cytosine methyltransferase [Kamptonema animale]MDB9513891.1 DNA cytosine methyltransferase [Kamptonema animale CS-326]